MSSFFEVSFELDDISSEYEAMSLLELLEEANFYELCKARRVMSGFDDSVDLIFFYGLGQRLYLAIEKKLQ